MPSEALQFRLPEDPQEGAPLCCPALSILTPEMIEEALLRNKREDFSFKIPEIVKSLIEAYSTPITRTKLSLALLVLSSELFWSDQESSTSLKILAELPQLDLSDDYLKKVTDLLTRCASPRSKSFVDGPALLELLLKDWSPANESVALKAIDQRIFTSLAVVDQRYLTQLKAVANFPEKFFAAASELKQDLWCLLARNFSSAELTTELNRSAALSGLTQIARDLELEPRFLKALAQTEGLSIEIAYQLGLAFGKLIRAVSRADEISQEKATESLPYRKIASVAQTLLVNANNAPARVNVLQALNTAAVLLEKYSVPTPTVETLLEHTHYYLYFRRAIPTAKLLKNYQLNSSLLVPELLELKRQKRLLLLPILGSELDQNIDIRMQAIYLRSRVKHPNFAGGLVALNLLFKLSAGTYPISIDDGRAHDAYYLFSETWRDKSLKFLREQDDSGKSSARLLADTLDFYPDCQVAYNQLKTRDNFFSLLEGLSYPNTCGQFPRINSLVQTALQLGVKPSIFRNKEFVRQSELIKNSGLEEIALKVAHYFLERDEPELLDSFLRLFNSTEGTQAICQLKGSSDEVIVGIVHRIVSQSSNRQLDQLIHANQDLEQISTHFTVVHKVDGVPWPYELHTEHDPSGRSIVTYKHTPDTLKATAEVHEVLRRSFDLHQGFGSLTYLCRRAPGQKSWPLHQFAQSVALRSRMINASTSEVPPGRGLLIEGPKPELFLSPNLDPPDPFKLYREAWPWASSAIDSIAKTKFLFFRGNLIISEPESPETKIHDAHYVTIAFYSEFANPFGYAVLQVPWKVLHAFLEGATLPAGEVAFNPDYTDVTTTGFSAASLVQRCEELGYPVLNLTWASNLGGLCNAYPPESEPYFSWEKNKAGSRDSAGHVHKYYLDGVRTDRHSIWHGILRQAHLAVYNRASSAFNTFDLLRLGIADWSKRSMLELVYAWNSQRLRLGIEDPYDFPCLIAAPALHYSRIPASPLILDTKTLVLTLNNGQKIELPPYSDGTGKEEKEIWNRLVLPLVGASDLELRLMDRRSITKE